jgi:hypothetical protein
MIMRVVKETVRENWRMPKENYPLFDYVSAENNCLMRKQFNYLLLVANMILSHDESLTTKDQHKVYGVYKCYSRE